MLSSVKSNCGPGTQLNRLSKVRFNFSILPPGGICLKIFQRRHGENDNQLDLIKTIPVCFITRPDMLTEFKQELCLHAGRWESMQMKAVASKRLVVHTKSQLIITFGRQEILQAGNFLRWSRNIATFSVLCFHDMGGLPICLLGWLHGSVAIIRWVIFAPHRMQISRAHDGTDERPVTPQVMGCDGPVRSCDGLDGGRPI